MFSKQTFAAFCLGAIAAVVALFAYYVIL